MSLPHRAPIGALRTQAGVQRSENPVKSSRQQNRVKKARRNNLAQSVLSPLSGLQYAHASFAGVSLRYTTCLCSVAPIGASICSCILCRGSDLLHHLPVFCRPYRGFNMLMHPLQGFRYAPPPACVLSPLSGLAITIRINMMPISMLFPYELRIMNCEL